MFGSNHSIDQLHIQNVFPYYLQTCIIFFASHHIFQVIPSGGKGRNSSLQTILYIVLQVEFRFKNQTSHQVLVMQANIVPLLSLTEQNILASFLIHFKKELFEISKTFFRWLKLKHVTANFEISIIHISVKIFYFVLFCWLLFLRIQFIANFDYSSLDLSLT